MEENGVQEEQLVKFKIRMKEVDKLCVIYS